jgi:hypothetical protein
LRHREGGDARLNGEHDGKLCRHGDLLGWRFDAGFLGRGPPNVLEEDPCLIFSHGTHEFNT